MPRARTRSVKTRVGKSRDADARLHLISAARVYHMHIAACIRSLDDALNAFNAFARANPDWAGKGDNERNEPTNRAIHGLVRSWTRLSYSREAAQEALQALGAWDETSAAEADGLV